MFSRGLLVLCVLQCTIYLFVQCLKKPKPPHIIFFLVDDMGWNDVGFHGMRQIPTPNIDTLAANGIILNNYYVSPACTPSRSALMSGKYPTESGLQHIAIFDASKIAMPIDYKILPQVLNDLGYVSRMVGKWHLGFYEKKYTPIARGFKSHYGFWTGQSDMFFHTSSTFYNTSRMANVPPFETRDEIEMIGFNLQDNFQRVQGRTGEYLTHMFTERSLKIIRQHNTDEPLFLYLSHHGVHRSNFYIPGRSPEEYTKHFMHIQESERRNFAGSLTAVDRSLGEVMETLQKKGMLGDTVLIFSSDNGAPLRRTFTSNGGSNYPLRGSKLTAFEGGVRANAFVWSPRLAERGKVYDGLMYIADWMPTLYKASGGDPKDLGRLDGVDMWEAINGSLPSPRTEVLHQSDPPTGLLGYRSGDYKIVSGSLPGPNLNGHSSDPAREEPPPSLAGRTSKTERVLRGFYGLQGVKAVRPVQVECGERSADPDQECDAENEVCLFNIAEDPCEYRNLAKRHPEIVKRLLNEMKRFKVIEPIDPPPDYEAHPVFHSGYFSPWVTDMCFSKPAELSELW